MKITEIKRKPNSKNIYLVYVDNKFWAELLDESIVQFRLKTQKECSEEFLKQSFFASRPALAMHYATNVLDRASKTEKQLMDYLLQKGFHFEVAETTTNKLKNYGYINDQKFAENFVMCKKNKGKKAIRFELKMKGIDEEIINNVLEEIQDQKDVILSLAQKFLNNKKPVPDLKQKLFRHLASKGFEFEEINDVIFQIYKEQK